MLIERFFPQSKKRKRKKEKKLSKDFLISANCKYCGTAKDLSSVLLLKADMPVCPRFNVRKASRVSLS